MGISVHCDDPVAMDALRHNFSAMTVPAAEPDLRYRVSPNAAATHVVHCGSRLVGHAPDLGHLIYMVDSDLIIQLQLIRTDLLFLHAAVLSTEGGAHLLVGRSGAGKSTTCWGLLHHGMTYLSDELAPIDLGGMIVHPFPRALCMKTPPPAAYQLPQGVLGTSRGFHVPVSRIPRPNGVAPAAVRTVFFVEYEPARRRPSVRPIGRAEAAARLYPQVLNALAHGDDAMHGVTRVASAARAFVVEAAELSATCEAIQAVLDH